MKKYFILLLLFFASITQSEGQGVCPPNIDFELGTTAIWNYFTGTCCPIVTPTSTPPLPSRHALTTGAGVDYYGGFPIVCPVGGSFSMMLGNDTGGAKAEKARYFVHVPTGVTNYSLVYRYAVVIEDPPSGHSPDTKPRFEVSATDSATGDTIRCASYSYVASSLLPGFVPSTVTSRIGNGIDVIYKDWATASINLSGLGGTTVAIDFASGDCSLGGHFGYGYFDMSCGLFGISGFTCNDTATHITLSAPLGFEFYTWYDSATFTTVYGSAQTITIPTPGSSTTFACILTPYVGYGCPDTLYSKITPTRLELDPSHDTTICSASSITLTSGATDIALPLTYDWSPATGLSCTSCANPVASPTVTTIYTVTVTDAAGCTKTASIVVNADPISTSTPTMSVVNDTCLGYNNGSITVTPTAGFPPFTYVWTTVPVQTGPTAGGLYAGTYSVTVTDNIGCTVTASASVLDGPPTVITLDGHTDPTTCFGADGTITLGGLVPGGSFVVKYYLAGVLHVITLIATGTGTVTITGLTQGTYANIGIITANCPYNTIATVVLTDPPHPVIAFTGSNSPVCLTSALDLFVTATPGSTFDWRGPAGFNSTLQNPILTPVSYLNAGYYYITITLNACTAKDSTWVVVKPLPLPSASNNTPVCTGDTLLLHATSSNGATSYIWNGPLGYYSNAQHPVRPNVTMDAAGTYTVTVTLNGCSVIDTTTVVVNQTPEPPGVENLEYCQFDVAVPLTATGTNLLWYAQAVGGPFTIVPPIPSTLLEGTTTWYVSQKSIEGCESHRSAINVQVDYFATPYIDFTDSVICMGNTFLFNAKGTGNDMTYLNWAFINDDTIHNVNPLRYSFAGPGTYTVTAIASYKVCPTKTATKVITVFDQPQVGVGGDTTICSGSVPIILTDERNAKISGTTWLWSTGTTGPSITIKEPGQYFVKVTRNGCTTTDTIRVADDCYIHIPNVFSPNEDGINDYFFPRQVMTKGLTSFKMDIFNRWGQLIFTSTSLDGVGWDGKFNDQPQPVGVYIYQIDATFKDGQKESHRGNVTLLK